MHVAMPLAAWSEHIWWSSVLRIRVAIVLVRWVVGDGLHGGGMGARGLGRRAAFTLLPRRLIAAAYIVISCPTAFHQPRNPACENIQYAIVCPHSLLPDLPAVRTGPRHKSKPTASMDAVRAPDSIALREEQGSGGENQFPSDMLHASLLPPSGRSPCDPVLPAEQGWLGCEEHMYWRP